MGSTLQLSTKIHQDTSIEAPHLRRRAPARPTRFFVADAQGRGWIYLTITFPPPAPSNNYKKFEAPHVFDAHGRRADQIQDHLAPPPTYKIPTVTNNYINLLPPRTVTDRQSRNPAPLTTMSRPTKPIASDKDVKPTVYLPTASDGGIVFQRWNCGV